MITAAEKTKGSTTGTSFTSASITPLANTTVFLAVATRMPGGTAANALVSVSGCNLTWTKIADQIYSADSHRRINLWKGTGTAPSAGTVTGSFSGQSQSNINWCIVEFSGVNPQGNVVQSASTYANATSVTATLGAFAKVANATVGAFGYSAGSETVGSGFTMVSDTGLGDQTGCCIEFKNTNDTTVDLSNSSTEMGVIATELNADLSNPRILLMMM